MKARNLCRTLVVGLLAAAVSLTGCDGEMDAAPELEAAPETAQEREERPLTRTAADVEWGPCPEFMPEGCSIAVVHGDPAEENADVFFRMAPNTTVPEHTHTSAERMVLISGEMHVDYEGYEPVVLTPGTYAYGPAGLPHSADCAEGDECVLFIAFEDPVDAIPVE